MSKICRLTRGESSPCLYFLHFLKAFALSQRDNGGMDEHAGERLMHEKGIYLYLSAERALEHNLASHSDSALNHKLSSCNQISATCELLFSVISEDVRLLFPAAEGYSELMDKSR